MVRGRPLTTPERKFYQRDNRAATADNRLEKLDENFPVDVSRCQHGSVSNPEGVPASLNNLSGEWAMVQLQENGHISTFTSPGLKDCGHRLFTQSFVDEVQQAAKKLSQHERPFPHAYEVDNFGKYVDTIDSDAKQIPRRQSDSTESSVASPSSRQGTVRPRTKKGVKSEEDGSRDGKPHKRTRYSRHSRSAKDDTPAPTSVIQTGLLVIGDHPEVINFYFQRFRQLQQTACKTIAKAFVKLMEPKKQSNFPYSGHRAKAPTWWPKLQGTDMVRHREPDHLLKNERVKLLVHVIQVVVDQTIQKNDHVKTITIKRLEEVTQEAMAPWWSETSKPNNIKKKPYLKEIFKIAKQEERYRKGELDPEAVITIMHGDSVEVPDDEPEEGINYNEEEIAALTLTPTTSQCSSPDNVLSPQNVQFQSDPHLRSPEGGSSETYGYNPIRDLPVRSYLQQGHPNTAEEHQGYSDNSQMPMGPQLHYMPRQPLSFQPQNLLQDPNRRPSWQPTGYPSPTPSSNFSNWTSTNMLPNTVQYTNFTGPPSQASAPAPYLPLPTSQSLLPPPMHPQQHMPYNESMMGRPYEGLPGPPPRNPHHQQSFQEYLCEGGYGTPSDAERSHQN